MSKNDALVSIQFEGRIPKRILSLGEDVYMDAALYYASILFKDVQLRYPCAVDIEFKKPEGGCLGQCLYIGEGEVELMINPSQSQRSALLTLAHEMVHVKQYVTGQMKDSPKGINYTIWQNKLVEISKYNYYDLPWEVDAMGREYGLYRRWIESRKYQFKAPWANTNF